MLRGYLNENLLFETIYKLYICCQRSYYTFCISWYLEYLSRCKFKLIQYHQNKNREVQERVEARQLKVGQRNQRIVLEKLKYL